MVRELVRFLVGVIGQFVLALGEVEVALGESLSDGVGGFLRHDL